MTFLTLMVIFVCAVLQKSSCYENLSRRSSTVLTQSSTIFTNVASLANDGNLRTTEEYCAHTARNQTLAWFQVDVGSPCNINNVKIYYRKEGNAPNDWKQFRFRQFYLDVSDLPANQTTTSQRIRCYTDNTTAPNLPPNIIDIPCKHTARYVIVETTYDAPEDDPYTTGVFLEMCEIEVYGCRPNCLNKVCGDNGYCTQGCIAGQWGMTCDSACPVNCKELLCDRQYGRCSGACTQGFWGDGCNKQCPAHCKGSACQKNNGRCTDGCFLGWYGDTCNDACSLRCAAGSCERHSGNCSAGCVQNWTGSQCDRCDATHYGPDCSRECSFNCIQKICYNITGSCTQGCRTGFYGDTCNNACSGCQERCNKYTGECEGACPIGKFGIRCDKSCGKNCQSRCDKNNGICTTCLDGMFGESCNETCSSGCVSGCDRHSGTCTCKPAQQWTELTTNYKQILSGIAAVLCLSVVLNIFLCIWILRERMCRRQNSRQSTVNVIDLPPVVYDSVAGDTGYQELGQVSGPSNYDRIKKN